MAKKTPKELTAEIKAKLASGELKVVMAPQNGVNFYEDIKRQFLDIVLKHPEAFISDESSLSDFNTWLPGVRLLTLEHFNVDIDPVMDKPLVEIFAYIDKKPQPKITLDELASELGLVKKKN